MRKSLLSLALVLLGAGTAHADGEAKNIIFFLGDGMGPTDVTAARVYKYGEDGHLHMEELPRTARVKTFSYDAQTTDSAPSMAAYMTGVKMRNEVISMTPGTIAIPPGSNNTVDNCAANGANGAPVATILEQAKAHGKAVGVVTTARVTHATPAATYAHICHRDLENAIAAQVVPGGAGANPAIGDGLNVLLGGGRKHFLPNTVSGGFRTDGRDLTAELVADGYQYVTTAAQLAAIDPATTTKVVGLFTASHMSYELDRPETEPSLADMTAKAIDILSRDTDGYFLMVEGGRIDHALHETNAIRALAETIEFDDAIQAALAKVDLSNTLIVVTADHDHTMVINGYAKRVGATTPTNPGILGLVLNVVTGLPVADAEGMPYSILGFGNGENRVAGARSSVPALTAEQTSALSYHQEAAVKMGVGGETHGGGDVMLMADGAGVASTRFKGTMDNTAVFGLLAKAFGF